MVMDILRMLITYENNDWVSEEGDYQDQLDRYNENKSHKRFTYYPWGLFVTAYARRNLWTGIVEFGDDYIYKRKAVVYRRIQEADKNSKEEVIKMSSEKNRSEDISCNHHVVL